MIDSASSIKKLLFLIPLLIALISCSQVSPEVNFSTGTVVFDYANENDLPSARLSVFVDVSSDAHRAETIKVESVSTGYEWETSNLLKFENGNRKYSGYTNFVMPRNFEFPQGMYKITYIDANDESVENMISLSYTAEVYKMSANDAASEIYKKGGTEYWAVYDENGIILFYGQKQNELTGIENVWQKYPNAIFVRTVWVSPGSRTICIMPKVYKHKVD